MTNFGLQAAARRPGGDEAGGGGDSENGDADQSVGGRLENSFIARLRNLCYEFGEIYVYKWIVTKPCRPE